MRKEVKEFIETLSNNMGHRERVKKFCEKNPTWNPLKGSWSRLK